MIFNLQTLDCIKPSQDLLHKYGNIYVFNDNSFLCLIKNWLIEFQEWRILCEHTERRMF